MSFELMNAPSTFQRTLDSNFGTAPFVGAYLNDIVIHAKTVDEHAEHVNHVL